MKECGSISHIVKFRDIPEKLLDVGEELFFAKNKVVFSQGDVPDRFYYIKDGRIKSYKYSPRGNEQIISLLEKGSIFLESGVLFDIPIDSYFETMEDSHLIFFRRKDLLDLLATDIDVTLYVMQSVSRKFHFYEYLFDELQFFDTEWRICNLLLTFADNFGIEVENKIKLNIKISQQFISNILGVNRGTTIKIINKLKELNLIEQTNGYYLIKDLQRLKNHQAEICVHKA
ncbi:MULTISPECIES: Crp/Fnr family transcriptional regulator [Dehalobacter]|jgi:CRP/FNR family transcriptional regulator|uniref:Cyclic nucleotide-binding domain-containing protein n=2 Tax=Dehalobacter restrictus TaxID=55583 RepID=A0A857DF44_9FIRM|nr:MULTISPECIES: Crp/Fnr family transcriptional regulator [Dehalobacter]AHF09370.1 cyclic nucleotide-binding protein [Dehalobacter restrictus DSM 9455]MCG1025840.1 Crp/Fnr family transcriptional regulator [Dehalobacter sp.]OCZ50963.1 cyclic nucleotide-binding protein [Dehalobacter sp. TeCB1]QGZ99893.1 cyclic nucleotide-binding domain-containing protein [Dehalobacter restrictus]